ncbi:unnamed protein product [Linum trigynum]|uniref:Uncharacterized protein n=1 Tax=Linum trigynum TaxID=586398 RepID=A0AAV2GKC7_9ROSI
MASSNQPGSPKATPTDVAPPTAAPEHAAPATAEPANAAPPNAAPSAASAAAPSTYTPYPLYAHFEFLERTSYTGHSISRIVYPPHLPSAFRLVF